MRYCLPCMVGILNILALWILTATPAMAASKTECARPWRLGYTLFWLDAEGDQPARPGSVRGVDYDLINELARRVGCSTIQLQMPLTRVLKQVESGGVDINGQKVCTPERGRYAWLLPYLRGKNHILFRRDQGSHLRVQDALADEQLRIGVVRGGVYGAAYDKLLLPFRASGKVVEEPDLDSLYRVFRLGRVGAIISTPPTYQAMLGQRYLDDKVMVVDWAPDEPVYPVCLLLSRKNFNAEQAAQVAAVLKTMRQDGTIQRILARHLGAKVGDSLLLSADTPTLLDTPR